MAKDKTINAIGKRKNAVARASAKIGTGKVLVNGIPIENMKPEPVMLLLKEPVLLAGDVAKGLDISVNVSGGGVMGQAQAARQAIAKALAEKSKALKKIFIEYDRTLLVSDIRRNEPHKPNASKRGPRRAKQRSKR